MVPKGTKEGGQKQKTAGLHFCVFSLFMFAKHSLEESRVNLLSLFPDPFINRSFFSGLAGLQELFGAGFYLLAALPIARPAHC